MMPTPGSQNRPYEIRLHRSNSGGPCRTADLVVPLLLLLLLTEDPAAVLVVAVVVVAALPLPLVKVRELVKISSDPPARSRSGKCKVESVQRLDQEKKSL